MGLEQESSWTPPRLWAGDGARGGPAVGFGVDDVGQTLPCSPLAETGMETSWDGWQDRGMQVRGHGEPPVPWRDGDKKGRWGWSEGAQLLLVTPPPPVKSE